MDQATILLIENNPDDVELTLHAFQKNHMTNDVVVAGGGYTLECAFVSRSYFKNLGTNWNGL